MTCIEYRRWLSPYVDEQLALRQRAELEAHLQTCVGCREELRALTQMLASLREMEPVAAPDLLPGIHRRLAQEPWWRVAVRRFTAPWPASLPVHGLALAACSALVLIITLLPQARSGKEKARPSTLKLAAAPQERFRGLAEEGKAELLGLEHEELQVRDHAGQLETGQADRQLTPSSPVMFYGMRSALEQVDAKKVNEPARTAVMDQMAPMKKADEAQPPLTILPEQQMCQSDDDCRLVSTSVSGCSCDAEALNLVGMLEHDKRMQQLREAYTGVRCDLYLRCKDKAACVSGTCTRVPAE